MELGKIITDTSKRTKVLKLFRNNVSVLVLTFLVGISIYWVVSIKSENRQVTRNYFNQSYQDQDTQTQSKGNLGVDDEPDELRGDSQIINADNGNGNPNGGGPLFTYTNINFPRLWFDYDSEVWTVQEINLDTTSPRRQIVLTSEFGDLVLDVRFSPGSVYTCDVGNQAKLIGGHLRIKDGTTYRYYVTDKVLERGSPVWQDVVNDHPGNPQFGNSDYCVFLDLPFMTMSDLVSNGVGVVAGQKYPMAVFITFVAESQGTLQRGIMEADIVMEALNY